MSLKNGTYTIGFSFDSTITLSLIDANNTGKLSFLDFYFSTFWLIYRRDLCKNIYIVQIAKTSNPTHVSFGLHWIKPNPILYSDEGLTVFEFRIGTWLLKVTVLAQPGIVRSKLLTPLVTRAFI